MSARKIFSIDFKNSPYHASNCTTRYGESAIRMLHDMWKLNSPIENFQIRKM